MAKRERQNAIQRRTRPDYGEIKAPATPADKSLSRLVFRRAGRSVVGRLRQILVELQGFDLHTTFWRLRFALARQSDEPGGEQFPRPPRTGPHDPGAEAKELRR
jgi:hypothetical protein